MTLAATSSRAFKPGTTGWTARDLDHPQVARRWARGRYEIVEGVLTTMPPAYFAGGNALFNLLFTLKEHLKQNRLPGRFAMEVDIVIDEDRVAVADAAFLTKQDETRQASASHRAGSSNPNRTRLLVPPTLIVESISPGHEGHDLRLKKRWYAEFRVPHYWIIDAFQESLTCLRLDGRKYRTAASGRGTEQLKTSLFPGLVIPLEPIWRE